MDIEKLAMKLEPLIPEQVRHWLSVRDVADADVKDLIEKAAAIYLDDRGGFDGVAQAIKSCGTPAQ